MCSCRVLQTVLAVGGVTCFMVPAWGQCQVSEVAKLTASDAAAWDTFGIAVRTTGDTVVVGARWNDDAGSKSGSAYIFRRDEGGPDNWGEVVKLTASDAALGDTFGGAVSISGDIVIVGAGGNDDAGSNSGSAYIFQHDAGGVSNWGEVIKLTASDAAAQDHFGAQVDVDGDIAVVGTYINAGADTGFGSAYVYYRDAGGLGNWGEVRKLAASDADTGDRFGFFVAVSGDTVLVAAPTNDDAGSNSGSVYILQRNEGGPDNWGELRKLTASNAGAADNFGNGAGINGDTAIVGAPHAACGPTNSGAAYIFQRNVGGEDNWGEVVKLCASDAATGDLFGLAVYLHGDLAVVGAPRTDNGASSGSIYVFHRNAGGMNNWGEVAKPTASDGSAGNHFGIAVSVHGDTVVVGSDFDNGSGSAYVFSVECNEPPSCDVAGPYTAECAGEWTSMQLDGSGSSDPDDDPLYYLWSTDCPSGSFDDETSATPLLTIDTADGCTTTCGVTLWVDDGNGGTSECSTTVTIKDTTPPVVTCAAVSLDGLFVLIEYSAWDACGVVTGSAVIETQCCPLPVLEGQVVKILCMNHEECKLNLGFADGTFKIKTDEAALVVTATDECGNEATCLVGLCVAD